MYNQEYLDEIMKSSPLHKQKISSVLEDVTLLVCKEATNVLLNYSMEFAEYLQDYYENDSILQKSFIDLINDFNHNQTKKNNV